MYPVDPLTRRRLPLWLLTATLVALGVVAPQPVPFKLSARQLAPLVYTIRFPEPATKTFDVEVVVPTEKRESVDLMMAIWSPGFYGLQIAAFMAHSKAR
jgi:M61 glycyl aminopeptidase